MAADSRKLEIVPAVEAELIQESDVPNLLERIRPEWKARELIGRVHRILPVDPSSACQRLMNAAIHDLREKVIVAGVDIAQEAARANKLPPVTSAEDVERYSTQNLIDLAYHMALLTRPEWRRLCRVYEIRRDLEHEDNEYVAGIEDCIYVFKTCIEVVLARDPIQPIRVTDFKDVVQKAVPAVLSPQFVKDYEGAPKVRKEEIGKYLVSEALNPAQSDVVKANCVRVLNTLRSHTPPAALIEIAKLVSEKVGRGQVDSQVARVAHASGTLAYLKIGQKEQLFGTVFQQMKTVGTDWRQHEKHGELLRAFREIGGLVFCPDSLKKDILKWLVVTYIGEPGGYGDFGVNRRVFFSDSAAPHIEELVREAGPEIRKDLDHLRASQPVKGLLANPYLAKRFERLVDMVPEQK